MIVQVGVLEDQKYSKEVLEDLVVGYVKSRFQGCVGLTGEGPR
jgi:hypothetical protein